MGDNYKRAKQVKSGIYKIQNKINNKFYIGSAVNIERRWRGHRFQLKRNKHHSFYLQRSYNKYGKDNFEYSIIEECSQEKLLEREQYYLDTLKPEYNSSPTAQNCFGVKHTPESNYKRGSYFRGKIGKDHPTSIPIYQYNLNGDFIKKWFGAAEIERELGFSSANIKKACKLENKHWTPYGFYWTREFLGDNIEPIKRRNRIKTCKRIGMFDDNLILIKEFASQKEAAIFLNIKGHFSINRASKKNKKAYGYYWKYI